MWTSDLLIILKSYLITIGLSVLIWPVIKKLFSNLPDQGWALGKVFVSVVCAMVVWQLSFLGISENNSEKLFAVIAVLGMISLWVVFREGVSFLRIDKRTFKTIMIEEYLFLIGFVAMAVVRAHAPSLDSLEKFMDFGFINMYYSSASLPAMDMWQAGMSINYYSFGHFWASVLIRILGVEAAVGYNLMLAFIFGTSMSLVFLASKMLSGRVKSWSANVGGVIGALAVLVAGNSHVIWYYFKNNGLDDYWYAEATRFIHNTIHEFPSYSFVVSDLHGHVLDLPIVLIFIIVMFAWYRERKRVFEVFLGGLFGVMAMTNTWDVAVYGLVMTVLFLQVALEDPSQIKRLVVSGGIMLASLLAVAVPWFTTFNSISNGVGLVTETSPLWQLLALWGGGLIVTTIAVLVEGRGKNKILVRTLAIAAILLIVIPEFVFARDIYPNHPRANTMFKLTYQAFIMMGILWGVVAGNLLDNKRKLKLGVRALAFVVVIGLFAGTMVFPTKSFPVYYNRFVSYFGLNGERWMETKIPENYAVVVYLRENRNEKNMVEAVGDSYTLFNSVSAFSGVPTIQGWRVHEWLWRGGYDEVASRESEVREIYQGSSLYEAKEILKKYNVGWILVGQDEKITYRINEEKIWQLGDIVFVKDDTYLIKVY